MATASISTPRVDIYTRVTNRIVEQLEQGIRPWMQPCNAEHAAGRIPSPRGRARCRLIGFRVFGRRLRSTARNRRLG